MASLKQRLKRRLRLASDVALRRELQLDLLGEEACVHVGTGVQITRTTVMIRGERSIVCIEDGVVMHGCRVVLKGDDCLVRIGANCVLQDSVHLICEDSRSRVELQPRVQVFHGVAMASTEGAAIRVGEGSMIAPGCSLRSGDSHAVYAGNTRINPAQDIQLGRSCWLGERAMILKGSVIPDGCIVGAASVVTRQFREPGCIIAGVPARVVKKGVRWSPERKGGTVSCSAR